MKISNEAKIGMMGTVALIVLFFGINFLKGMSIFSSEAIYYIQFKNAKGLSKNSTVFADGFNIGRVSNVIYNYKDPGKVFIEIAVDYFDSKEQSLFVRVKKNGREYRYRVSGSKR